MSNKDFQNGVALGLAMGGVVESSGGASLNIAYGETPPEDTSKLWIKANEPNKLHYSSNIDGVESIKSAGPYLSKTYRGDGTSIAKIGTKFYLFAGINVTIYDTVTNSVTDLGDILTERLGHPFCYVKDDEIYLIGGNDKGTIYIFDTKTNTITTHTVNSGFTRFNCPYTLVGNKIYCFGGTVSGYPQNYINVFDLETETHTTLSVTLPSVRYGICAEVIGTKIYLFGGWGGAKFHNSIYIFDTETDTMQTLDVTLPEGVESACCSKIGNKIYLFGGRTYSSSYTNAINVFNTETETIETLETTLPNKDYQIGCYTDGTKIYLFGGSKYGESINIFTITHELTQGDIEIETATTKNLFKLINTDMAEIECGVENVYIGNENNEAELVDAYLYKHLEETKVDKRCTDKCFQTTSGTSLTADVDCSVGDLVVASIITRDTLTLSDGWTLISTSEVNSTDSNNQRLSFAYKYAESTNESITVTQASSQRLYINMVALQGATGFVDNGYNYVDSAASSITVTKPCGLTLWGCSAVSWGSTSPYSQWESSNDALRVDLGTETQSRLAVFLDQSDDTEVTFTAAADSTTIIVGSLTIEGMDAFYAEEFKEWDEWVQV